MKRIPSPWLAATVAVLVGTWLTAAQAGAQEPRGGERGGGGAGGSGAAGARGDSSGGGSASAGGSSASGGGSASGGSSTISSGGGGFNGGGVRSGAHGGGATGGSGMRRETDSGSRVGSIGGDRSSRANSGAGSGTASGTSAAGGGPGDGGRAATRGDDTGRSGRTLDANDGVPSYARPRDGRTVIGTATPRGTGTTPGTPGVVVVIPGGYYGGGFYDPYGYDAYGYGGLFGYGYGSSYGYGGYYDPWYGGYPSYGQSGATSTYQDEGTLKLKIKPREAEVYVDGYYVGIVDDFDGLFQRLRIETGPHRVEVHAPGYEPLAFDVRISPDHATTYQGELKKIQ